MPHSRFYRLADAQKVRILEAAQSELAREGYEGASLETIATRAQMSKAKLYYYFSDRDDLFATVLLSLIEAVSGDEVMGAFAPRRPSQFWRALEQLVRAGLDLASRHPEEMRVLRTFQMSVRRNPRPAYAPVLEQMASHLRHIVAVGREFGCVRSDVSVETLVELLQAADEVLDGILFRTDALARQDTRAKHAALTLDTFRRLLEPPRTARPHRAGKKARPSGAGSSI